jgi:predicted nucleotidyltransferase
MIEINVFLEDIVDSLRNVEGLQALVLGGSWASGTQRPDSDIDLGLYYSEETPLDVYHLRKIAKDLNDFSNPEVTELGGWGSWVNGGAWLTIRGQRVDFLYRNIDFVSTVIDECNRGEIRYDYLQQPPYGFYSYIYCAETELSQVLYDPKQVIAGLKTKVARYSAALQYSIINSYLWHAEFSLENATKAAHSSNAYYVAGCLTRIASSLVQVLYALNETYFISDKRLHKDIELFSLKPQGFVVRIDRMLGNIGCDSKSLIETLAHAESLLDEIIELCGGQYIQWFDLDALSPKTT